jgi:enamine deaminase RidA (YjgF/YER057c/UK114 family)
MEIKPVNPWKWQDAFGFSQAIEFTGHSRVLTCAGQTSVDADGAPLHEGDMAAQIGQALDNIEKVLKQAGMTLANVVHLNYYTTDVDAFLQHSAASSERLKAANCHPASTLLGVTRLAFPPLMIEMEATAVA